MNPHAPSRYLSIMLMCSCFCLLSGQQKPNVLFILADDLGYGDLSCYGATEVQTPGIDRLAGEGRIFTDAHSPSSVCTPSRYNLITGRYAWRTWIGGSTVWANDPLLIEEDRFTLADLFKSQGYQTACIGKWHLGFGKPGIEGWDDILGPNYNLDLKPGPLELGFDYFWGFPHVGQFPHFIIENHRVLGLTADDPIEITPDPRPGYELDYLNRPRLGAARLGVKGGESSYYQHEGLCNMVTRRTVEWIENVDTNRPFFLYLAHRNIHAPLIPDPKYTGKSRIGKRGDFLMEFDDSVASVLHALDRRGLADNTIVIFTSDNGGVHKYEPIDYPVDNGHRLNGPLRGQKTYVYEGGHRVPLIVRWPGRIEPQSKSDALIALTDMLATFADFFGVSLPANCGEDSFSALGPILGMPDRQTRRTLLVNDSYRTVLSIRENNWKLILAQNGAGANSPTVFDPAKPLFQLYDLDDDIAEKVNLFNEHPEIVYRLMNTLEQYRTSDRSAPVIRTGN